MPLTKTKGPAAPRGPGRSQPPAPEMDPVDLSLAEPVERQVYRSIRNSMMRGHVKPDAVLSGRSIAQSLGISMQPVRDALKRLEAEGLVEARPQSGFVLPPMTRQEYWETVEIRTRIEGLAGRLAVSRMTPAKIERLIRLNAQLHETENPERYLARNFAFHFAIYTESRRTTLLSLIENFWVRIGPILHHHPAEGARETTHTNHLAIIDALRAGDEDGVEVAIRADLEEAATRVTANLD